MQSYPCHQIASFIAKSFSIAHNGSVPSLEDLPLYDSNAEAGVKLSKQVRKELVHSPRIREVNQLVAIARPLASDMKLLKPSLTRECNQHVPFKVSFTLTCIVFVVSTVLHLLFMYIYHKYHLADRLFSKKLKNKIIKLKPCFEIPEKHKDDFPDTSKTYGAPLQIFPLLSYTSIRSFRKTVTLYHG